MNILALDSATDACSVGLLREDGEQFTLFDIQPRAHTRLLLQMLDQVITDAAIAKSDISRIAYTNGPGAFTGVRIGVATAQGLALGLAAKQVPLSTLQVVAQQCYLKLGYRQMSVALDARMNEVYVGRFAIDEHGIAQALEAEQLIPITDLKLPVDGVAVGSGFTAACDAGILSADSSSRVNTIWPTAHALLDIVRLMPLANRDSTDYQPGINYIRNKVAEKKRPQP